MFVWTGETVWLTQMAMSELFETTKQNISLHLKNIFSEGELEEESVVKEYLTTAADGKNYRTKMYNLEAIISVGYRIRSHRGVQFRKWATERLKEYIVKGFTMDDERLSEPRKNASIRKYAIFILPASIMIPKTHLLRSFLPQYKIK